MTTSGLCLSAAKKLQLPQASTSCRPRNPLCLVWKRLTPAALRDRGHRRPYPSYFSQHPRLWASIGLLWQFHLKGPVAAHPSARLTTDIHPAPVHAQEAASRRPHTAALHAAAHSELLCCDSPLLQTGELKQPNARQWPGANSHPSACFSDAALPTMTLRYPRHCTMNSRPQGAFNKARR